MQIQAATADAKAEHSKLLQYYAAQARAVAAGTARRMVVQASKPEVAYYFCRMRPAGLTYRCTQAKGPAAKVGVAAAQPVSPIVSPLMQDMLAFSFP